MADSNHSMLWSELNHWVTTSESNEVRLRISVWDGLFFMPLLSLLLFPVTAQSYEDIAIITNGGATYFMWVAEEWVYT